MAKRGLILGGVLVLFSGIFVSNTFAESANTDFNIKVNPSLSLSVSSPNVGFSLTPTQAGSYDSASFNVYSSTNNIAGYTLTMSTDKVDLESDTINPTTGTKPTIPTLTETQNGITAAQFEASISADVLNHWGISVAGANYNAMKPSQEIRKTTANNTTEDTTTISLASKLDLLTVPGVYSTTINFELVANIYTKGGSINENGRYPANSLLRAFEIAYTEAGKPMYIEDANTDIGWRPMVGADFDTVGGKEVRFAIQDITMTFEENGQTKNVCGWAAASTIDQSDIQNPFYDYKDIALVMDLRDGTNYNIVKTADGNCWTQDNLALDLSDSNVKNRLSPTNTNASVDAIDALLNGGRAKGDRYATAGINSDLSDNSYSIPQVSVSGSCNLANMCVNDPTELTWTKDSIETDTGGSGKIGAYYNYCAASAGSYCYGNGTTSGTAVDRDNTYQDAEYDICPFGWRLPLGNATLPLDDNDFESVRSSTNYMTYTLAREILQLPISGFYLFYNHFAAYQVSRGYYWTSTYRDNTEMNMVNVVSGNSSIDTQGHSSRTNGYSVRCVAK